VSLTSRTTYHDLLTGSPAIWVHHSEAGNDQGKSSHSPQIFPMKRRSSKRAPHARRLRHPGAVLPPVGAGANVARLCANVGQCGATAVRRRSCRPRAIPGPVARCASAKHWGDSGGTPEGKDGEIRVRMGKFKSQHQLGRGATTGVFGRVYVENKGLELAPQVGLEPTTLRLTAERLIAASRCKQ
jgi:hypothetical protein